MPVAPELTIDQVESWAATAAAPLDSEARMRMRVGVESRQVIAHVVEHAASKRELAGQYFEREVLGSTQPTLAEASC